MTAPDPDAPVDPVVCINARMASEESECGFPEGDHCPGCRMCPGLGNCICHQSTPLDNETLRAALDSYAVRHEGVTSWQAWTDVAPIHVVEERRCGIEAAIAPLQARIRRLTASPDPARLPSARELVEAWNRRTPDEQLALADQFLERQEHAHRCALGRCTTKENS